MKKLWRIAGRKDAELTSLYSVQSLHRPPGRALRHRTVSPLPLSFLTSSGPQRTAVAEESNEVGGERGRERAATPGDTALAWWRTMVSMEDCEVEGVGRLMMGEGACLFVCLFSSSDSSSRPSQIILKSIFLSGGGGPGSVEEVHCEEGRREFNGFCSTTADTTVS